MLDHTSFQTKSARELIADQIAGGALPCVTCSFQLEGVVLLDLVRRIEPAIPVLFIDTVHHFAETHAYCAELTELWNLNLIVLRAPDPRPGLWQQDTRACCAHHKVQPLFAALEQYDVWLTGLRREQSPSRANLEPVDAFALPSGKVVRKVSPLAHWTTSEVWTYAKSHDIPVLPLYDSGYSSIGCEPCTSRPLDPLNPRSGRWNGERMECGIHLPSSVSNAPTLRPFAAAPATPATGAGARAPR
jgi:phosphoadenosine phosphosulfate reductase